MTKMSRNSASEGREPFLAPAESLLGQLQRGRGHGMLRAVRHDAESVHTLLLECIHTDPRWDRDWEHRDQYYARLAELTGLHLAPIRAHLRAYDDFDRLGNRTYLALQTLSHLAARGYGEALDILREYASYGRRWDQVIAALAMLDRPDAYSGLDQAICRRFLNGREMLASLIEPPLCPSEIWMNWSKTNTDFRRLLNEFQELVGPIADGRPVHAFDPELTVLQLLEMTDEWNHEEIAEELTSRVLPTDIDALQLALAGDNPYQWWVAIKGLNLLGGDETAQYRLLRRLQEFIEGSDPKSPRDRQIVERLLLDMPPHLTRDLSRRWFNSSDPEQRRAGAALIQQHATPDDLSRLLAVLMEAHQGSRPYNQELSRVIAILRSLERFRNQGPFHELETLFIETCSSHVRYRAAETMWATAPEPFSQSWALECLWDCERETRILGCRAVELLLPGARERLLELGEDRYESNNVRLAASARLSDHRPSAASSPGQEKLPGRSRLANASPPQSPPKTNSATSVNANAGASTLKNPYPPPRTPATLGPADPDRDRESRAGAPLRPNIVPPVPVVDPPANTQSGGVISKLFPMSGIKSIFKPKSTNPPKKISPVGNANANANVNVNANANANAIPIPGPITGGANVPGIAGSGSGASINVNTNANSNVSANTSGGMGVSSLSRNTGLTSRVGMGRAANSNASPPVHPPPPAPPLPNARAGKSIPPEPIPKKPPKSSGIAALGTGTATPLVEANASASVQGAGNAPNHPLMRMPNPNPNPHPLPATSPGPADAFGTVQATGVGSLTALARNAQAGAVASRPIPPDAPGAFPADIDAPDAYRVDAPLPQAQANAETPVGGAFSGSAEPRTSPNGGGPPIPSIPASAPGTAYAQPRYFAAPAPYGAALPAGGNAGPGWEWGRYAPRERWSLDDLIFLPAGASRAPLESTYEPCLTRTVLGTRFATNPLALDIPLLCLVSGTPWRRHRNLRHAVIRSARQVGSSSVVTPEDLDPFIQRDPREPDGVRLLTPDRRGQDLAWLRMASAVEIQFGTGISTNAYSSEIAPGDYGASSDLDAAAKGLNGAYGYALSGGIGSGYRRHPDWLGPDDLGIKIEELREATDWKIPIFVRVSLSRVFEDVRLIAKAGADVIVLASPPRMPGTLSDHMHVPLLSAIVEARQALVSLGLFGIVQLVVADGLRHGADCAKVMALGADACAIDPLHCLPLSDPSASAMTTAVMMSMEGETSANGRDARIPFDEELPARRLHALTAEIQDLARACGKSQVRHLEPEDLRTLSWESALVTGIPLAGGARFPMPWWNPATAGGGPGQGQPQGQQGQGHGQGQGFGQSQPGGYGS